MPAQYKRTLRLVRLRSGQVSLRPGFAFVLILAILLIIGAAAAVGLYFVTKNPSSKPATPIATQDSATIKTPEATVDETADWKTYNAQSYTFKYPSDWEVVPLGSNGSGVVITTPEVAKDLKDVLEKGEQGGCMPTFPIVIDQASSFDESIYQSNAAQQVSKNSVVIDGVKGVEYSIKVEQAPCINLTGESKTIMIQKNAKIFTLNLENSDNQVYQKVFNQFLSTFKFTE